MIDDNDIDVIGVPMTGACPTCAAALARASQAEDALGLIEHGRGEVLAELAQAKAALEQMTWERETVAGNCALAVRERDRLRAELADAESRREDCGIGERTALEMAEALRAELAQVRVERDEARALLGAETGSLMGGWLSRNEGAALTENPHPPGSIEFQWWEKGWQWRDDALGLDACRALMRELAEAGKAFRQAVNDRDIYESPDTCRDYDIASDRLDALVARAEDEGKRDG